MDDAALIEAMLSRYRAWSTTWDPPPPGALTGPAGGFSGGPYGLAVRYVLRDCGGRRECVWLETSRMDTVLMRIGAGDEEPESLDSMWTAYIMGDTPEETAAAQRRMHDHNAAFWERVGELGLSDRLPMHTQVNAYLTSGHADGLDAGGPPGRRD